MRIRATGRTSGFCSSVGLAMSSYPTRLNSIDTRIAKHKVKNNARILILGSIVPLCV